MEAAALGAVTFLLGYSSTVWASGCKERSMLRRVHECALLWGLPCLLVAAHTLSVAAQEALASSAEAVFGCDPHLSSIATAVSSLLMLQFALARRGETRTSGWLPAYGGWCAAALRWPLSGGLLSAVAVAFDWTFPTASDSAMVRRAATGCGAGDEHPGVGSATGCEHMDDETLRQALWSFTDEKRGAAEAELARRMPAEGARGNSGVRTPPPPPLLASQ